MILNNWGIMSNFGNKFQSKHTLVGTKQCQVYIVLIPVKGKKYCQGQSVKLCTELILSLTIFLPFTGIKTRDCKKMVDVIAEYMVFKLKPCRIRRF